MELAAKPAGPIDRNPVRDRGWLQATDCMLQEKNDREF
jgi:hypothetical protein